MLTIVTGTPGNGKTAHSIDLCFFQESSIWHGLDKYVDGIAELKLPHFEFPDIKELKDPKFLVRSKVDSDDYAIWLPEHPMYPLYLETRATAKTAFDLWFLWATPGSVLLIDEAQRYMRPKPAGAPVPLSIQMIEYHRHFGIHMIFIAQKERLLHSNVRMLAGQHIHLTDGWRGRHRFEWPECKDTDSKSEKSVSAHADYKLPKHVFPYYKSTVEHLNVKHKKPLYAYAAWSALILAPVLLAAALYRINKFPDSVKTQNPLPSETKNNSISPLSVQPPASSVQATFDYIDQFKPTVEGHPESAPVYAHLRQVVNMPRVAVCMATKSKCYCYSQQGSRLYEITEERCRQNLDNGKPFSPYNYADANEQIPSGRPLFTSAEVVPLENHPVVSEGPYIASRSASPRPAGGVIVSGAAGQSFDAVSGSTDADGEAGRAVEPLNL